MSDSNMAGNPFKGFGKDKREGSLSICASLCGRGRKRYMPIGELSKGKSVLPSEERDSQCVSPSVCSRASYVMNRTPSLAERQDVCHVHRKTASLEWWVNEPAR